MPVVPRGWCTRLIETRLLGSGTCARPGLPVKALRPVVRGMFAIRTNGTHRVREPSGSIKDLRRGPISYLMVGVAIGFTS